MDVLDERLVVLESRHYANDWHVLRPRCAALERTTACGGIRSTTVEHPELLLIPALGLAIAAGGLLLSLTRQAGNLTTKRRIAARIKQIIEVCEHSEKDSAKRLLQEQLDKLVLRYSAMTVIRLSRRDKIAITLASISTIALFVIGFWIQYLNLGPRWLEGILMSLAMIVGNLFTVMSAAIRLETLKVNRDLFVLLERVTRA